MEGANSASWDVDISDSTADPSISLVAEEVPSLTVTTILGITILIVIAIVMVFVLGILIDCRQQKILDRRIGEIKRLRNQRRGQRAGDVVRIADSMEDTASSPAPAEVLREIP